MKKIIVLLTLCGILTNTTAQNKEFSSAHKLQAAEYLIHNLYVDSLNENTLVEAAIRGMISSLDPHSSYSTPEEVKLFKESVAGEFVGIGIQYQFYKDTLYVIKTIKDGPSQKAGVKAGDRIITINGEATPKNVAISDVSALLRGPKGSKVEVGVLREENTQLIPITIKRDKIPVESLMASYMITPEIGYINLNQFGRHSHEEFLKALKDLKKQKMASLILDLRGNSGGLLNISVDIANEFLNAKERIVYANGQSVDLGSFYAKGDGKFKDGKLIILQDEASASASEILAGAIQDWDRGLIIGRRSFGKGLVQRPLDLPDGSMIRLTIARYYTPSGRYIQKPYEKGADGQRNYRHEILERLDRGELIQADSIHQIDSLQFHTLNKGRMVYGGGGIMPDVFMPIDSIYLDKEFQKVSRNDLFQTTYLSYITQNQTKIRSEYNEDEFISSYKVPTDMLQKIMGDVNREDIQDEIERILKALIGRSIYSDDLYYKINNETDPVILKAISILQSDQYEKFLN